MLILATETILATHVPYAIFNEVIVKHGAQAPYLRPDTLDSGITYMVCPLKGLRPDGGMSAIERGYGRLGQSVERTTVTLYYSWEPGTILGDIRTIEATRDVQLRDGRDRLQQQVIVDPKGGMRLLGTSKALLEVAHYMEVRALELARQLPEYLEPVLETA